MRGWYINGTLRKPFLNLTVQFILYFSFDSHLFRNLIYRALYHTLAGHDFLKRRSVANLVSHFWWFRGFIWMEENIKVKDFESK